VLLTIELLVVLETADSAVSKPDGVPLAGDFVTPEEEGLFC
jgi:hypothetical protein